MSEHSERKKTGYSRLISAMKQEAVKSRSSLRRERNWPGFLSEEQEKKCEAVAALADFHDVLYEHRHERSLKEPINERLPFNPQHVVNSTKTVEQPVACRNRDATQNSDIPVPALLTFDEIWALAKELDDIAKELGLAAEVRESRERFHIAAPDADHPEPYNDNVKKPGE